MTTISSPTTVPQAKDIPYTTADEAHQLLQTELERFLALLETLEAEEWQLPTACTEWNVRDMVAHQAGGYASGTGYLEMLRQYTRLPRRGELPEDAINRHQLAKRAGMSPAALIAELRETGAVAARNWAHHFRLIKAVAIPHAVGGLLSVRHLMWVIHSRDTWMHRLDICRATGRDFQQSRAHDGRIAALVMRDVEKRVRKTLDGRAVLFDLTGVAGGTWNVGEGEPAATIRMDVLDFNIFASGRFTFDEARERAALSGDVALAEAVLENTLILY